MKEIYLAVFNLLFKKKKFSQNLESKLASCREYVQEQTSNRKAHPGGQGAPSSHNNPSENSTTNGLYSKG